ncbi:lasso peptide biosynthesis B2 protein [Tsuneonella dongtanensis]|nr:lasso peptide biosynthesis B2 protein [Tsuneonella dongtanensis]
MIRLLVAMALVQWIPLGRWGWSLGSATPSATTPLPQLTVIDPDTRAMARRIERAAWRLPFTVKCLPQAMVLQWWLKRTGRGGSLVIAVHANDRESGDCWHAWVEQGGVILIGDCERSEYRPLVAFQTLAHAG